MGKTRKSRKAFKARDDPVGLDSAIAELENGMEREFGVTGDESIIENIIEQLKSVNPEDRICGCHSLASLTSREGVREKALQSKVVRICGPLLIDPDQQVVQAAAGCLHNLSCEGGEVVDQLVKQDVLTSLTSLLEKYRGVGSQQEIDKDIKILIEAFGLMWNLMEQSQAAINIFNKQNLLEIILQFLDIKYPSSIVLVSLSLLATACDSNITAQKQMAPNFTTLTTLLECESSSNQVKVTTAVVLLNMLKSQIYNNSVFPTIMSVVSDCLMINSTQLVSEMSSSSEIEEENGEMEVEGASDESRVSIAGEKCKNILKAQVLSLEIIANLTCQEDGEENVEDLSDDEDFDEEGNPGFEEESSANPAFIEAVVAHKLLETILLRANDLPANIKELLSPSKEGKTVIKLHKQLVVNSFLCSSNLVDTLTMVQLGGSESLYKTWTGLGIISCQKDAEDCNMIEAASSAMRSATSKLCQDAEGGNLFNLAPEDLDNLVAVYANSQASIRTNIVNIVGDLAGLAAKTLTNSRSVEILSILGSWLVDNAAKDENLRVVAEALDKLFDIFAEDDSDEIFASLKLLQKLRSILSPLKSRIGQNKRTLGEDLPIVNMAKTNLQRFIKYKEKRPIIAKGV